MKTVIAFSLALCPAVASAQGWSNSQPSMNGPNYSTYIPLFASNAMIPPSDTPTMRRQKLQRARALRAEVDAMLQENDGALTEKQEAYVRRSARRIIDGR